MENSPAPDPAWIDALAAGVLTSMGRTQVEIARQLKLSQSAVSRLLKKVQGRIRVQRTFNWAGLELPVQNEVNRRVTHPEIADLLASLAGKHGHAAPAVHVMPVEQTARRGAQLAGFATHAASILRDLLQNVRGPVGVAWGNTIWETALALRSILPQRPFSEGTRIEFIPLCGDPLIDPRATHAEATHPEATHADRTSSRIVSELNKTVNGDQVRPAWLGLVPAFIPLSFKKNEIRVIDKLIDLVPQYSLIFGPRTKQSRPALPLAGDLHMIITAAGPSERPIGFGSTPLLGLTAAQSKLLADSIYGDIGGVLLPRPSKESSRDGRQRKAPLVEELTIRWTGLKLEHLRACSSRAFSERISSRPGVTLLGFGSDRLEVVLEAVRQGLVNQLIIGSDLEEALSQALGGKKNNAAAE